MNSANNVEADDPARHGVLPNLCEAGNLLLVILLTLVLAITLSLSSADNPEQFWDTLALSSVLMLWIALLDVAVLCLLRRHLRRYSTRLCLLYSFLAMMLVSFLVAITVTYIDRSATTIFGSTLTPVPDNMLLIRIISISSVVYFLILRYMYIQHQWRRNVLAQSEAQVQSLRARIRPHFLFNSMNTIASLVETSPTLAEQAIENLSDLFRASLGEHEMNSVQDEIQLTESYLEIEHLRLGDRLEIEWRVDDSLLSAEIPALLLQPLVENAVYHGIEPLPKGGKITISLLHKEGMLELSVSNPVPTGDTGTQRRRGNQIAQDSIRQRLTLVYGTAGGFSINDTKDNYTVTLIIPLGVNYERANRR